MFASLNADERRRVHDQGSWIVFPYGDFDRLIPEFIIPLDPLLVPVPADSLALVASLSSSMVYNSSGAPPSYENPQPEAGPSTSNTRATRSQTRAGSKLFRFSLVISHHSDFLFVGSNVLDNDHTSVMLPRTRA